MNLSTVKWAQWDKAHSRDLLGPFICVCIALCTIVAHILHRTDPIIFPLTTQTITIAPTMSIWGKGGCRWIPIVALFPASRQWASVVRASTGGYELAMDADEFQPVSGAPRRCSHCLQYSDKQLTETPSTVCTTDGHGLPYSTGRSRLPCPPRRPVAVQAELHLSSWSWICCRTSCTTESTTNVRLTESRIQQDCNISRTNWQSTRNPQQCRDVVHTV